MATINKGLKRQKVISAKALAKANHINHVITTTHRHLFQPGVTFTQKDLADMMNLPPIKRTTSYPKMQKQQMVYMQAYVQLNQALCERGLVIRSSDYYQKFHVLATHEIQGKVQSYQSHSATLSNAAQNLDRNFNRFKGKWRKLGPKQVQRVAHRLKY